MKKSLIVLLSAIIAVNVSGCKKSSDKMRENTDSSKTYESNVNNDETNLFNESEKPLIQTEKNTSTSENDKNVQTEFTSESNNTEKTDSSDFNDRVEFANAVYQKGMDMYSQILLSCPYKLDYDTTNESGFAKISDSSINSIDDIVSLYCTVFAEPDLYIYERYSEDNGSVYCSDASRGTNIYYSDTDLEFISGDETELSYNAVSHYSDPETGKEMDDKISVFTIKLIDGSYKITEFTFPK